MTHSMSRLLPSLMVRVKLVYHSNKHIKYHLFTNVLFLISYIYKIKL